MFVDAIIKLVISLVMLPVIIMAWLFPATRSIVKQAISGVLASALSIFFTLLVGSICVKMLEGVIANVEAVGPRMGEKVIDTFGAFSLTDMAAIIIIGLMTNALLRGAPKMAAEFVSFQGSMGDAGSAAGGAIKGAAGAAVGVATGMLGAKYAAAQTAKAFGKAEMKGGGGEG